MKEMKKISLLLAAIVLGHIAFAQYSYPPSKTVEVSDTYFGTVVADPYRWLEDIKNEEVLDWFNRQAEFTNNEMSKIANQDKLIEELKMYDAMRSVAYLSAIYIECQCFAKLTHSFTHTLALTVCFFW